MRRLYRFVPCCRKLNRDEEALKGLMCLMLDCDMFNALVEFEDGTKVTLFKEEIIEVKFGNKDIWVY